MWLCFARDMRIFIRRAAEAARAARFAKPSKADETNDARWELVLALAFAAALTPLVAALADWILPIVWSWK